MLPSASQSSLQSQPSPKSEHVGGAINEHTIRSMSNSFNGLSVDPSSYQGNNSYSQPTTGNVNQQQHHDMFYPNVNSNLQNTSMGSVGSTSGFNWTSNPASPAQPRPINEMSQQSNQQLFSNNQVSTNGSNSNILQSSDVADDRKRNESIDLFLSRSPSQTLGSEFLKLNKGGPETNNTSRSNAPSSGDALSPPPGINNLRNNLSNDTSGQLKMKNSGRDTSPSCSVTGTSASSRTSSPSWNSAVNDPTGARNNNWSMAYNNNNNNSPADMNHFAAGMTGKNDQERAFQQQLHSNQYQRRNSSEPAFPSAQSYNDGTYNLGSRGGRIGAYNGDNGWSNSNLDLDHTPRNRLQHGQSHGQHGHQGQQPIGLINALGNNKNEYPGNSNYSSHFAPSMQPNPNDQQQQQQNPQVFYMPISTQDGQQVLQPVQMVQVPGQPNAFMLPQGSAMPTVVSASPSHGLKIPTISPAQGDVLNNIDHKRSMTRSPHHLDSNLANQMARSPRVDGLGRSNGMHKKHLDIDGSSHTLPDDLYSRYPRKSSYNQMNVGGITDYGNDQFYQKAGPTAVRRQSGSASSVEDHLESPHASRGHEVVSTLYASPQRPPLKDLLGHVRRLSRDQVGCRLLQQALDEEGDSAATLILNEGLTFWGEAMVDPFGNYLFQKILEKITPEERITLLENVNTRLVNASLNLHGTRSVQKIVELCAVDEVVMSEAKVSNPGKPKSTAAEILTQSLAPAAARLCIDSHGNHVIQRILLKLPYHYSQFVFDAVASSVEDVARHRHGCCVIQRCLDSPPSKARSNLVYRIVEKALELMQDAYGNYVVQYVLDVCSDDDVHAVCEGVVGKVNLLAIQKFSSNVMEKCLERCTDKTRGIYLEELSDTNRIRELVMDPFGNYVVQKALAVATHAQAVKLVEAIRPHFLANGAGSSSNGGVRNSAGGRRIMAKICRRFPNFNLGIENTGQVSTGQESFPSGNMN